MKQVSMAMEPLTNGSWVAICKLEWVSPPDKVFVGEYGAVVEAAKEWWAAEHGFEYVIGDPDPWRDEDGEPFGETSLDDAGRLSMVTDEYGECRTIFIREAELCEPVEPPDEGPLTCGACGIQEGDLGGSNMAITYQETVDMPVCTICLENYGD